MGRRWCEIDPELKIGGKMHKLLVAMERPARDRLVGFHIIVNSPFGTDVELVSQGVVGNGIVPTLVTYKDDELSIDVLINTDTPSISPIIGTLIVQTGGVETVLIGTGKTGHWTSLDPIDR